MGPRRLFTGHFRSLTIDLFYRYGCRCTGRHTRSEGHSTRLGPTLTLHTPSRHPRHSHYTSTGGALQLQRSLGSQYQRAAASLRPSATRPHCTLHTTHSHVRTCGAHGIERPGAAGRCACAKRSEEPGHALPCVSARLGVGHSGRSSPPPENRGSGAERSPRARGAHGGRVMRC